MKITEEELQGMIKEAVKKKIAALNESSDFTAKRQIVHSAASAAMEFEAEIKSGLGLIDPDQLPPNLQDKYFNIAEEMKAAVVKVVADAVRRFASLPRVDNGQGEGRK